MIVPSLTRHLPQFGNRRPIVVLVQGLQKTFFGREWHYLYTNSMGFAIGATAYSFFSNIMQNQKPGENLTKRQQPRLQPLVSAQPLPPLLPRPSPPYQSPRSSWPSCLAVSKGEMAEWVARPWPLYR